MTEEEKSIREIAEKLCMIGEEFKVKNPEVAEKVWEAEDELLDLANEWSSPIAAMNEDGRVLISQYSNGMYVEVEVPPEEWKKMVEMGTIDDT